MKPGATTWPPASITRRASPRSPEPTATTRSPSTATSAGAVAFRATRLDDEVRDDAVEGEPVVEPPLGERHEVRDGLWRVLWEELDPDLAPLLERDDGGLRHPLVLIWGRSSRTSRGRRP